MATSSASQGPSIDVDPPVGVPLVLAGPRREAEAPSRRLPPPCWTPEETSALIDAYREKWYSLRRGNLRAAHWEDVAEQIHRVCPEVCPPKTAVQCRHKMEKLRKRYRAELQRAKSIPHHRFSSSWVYFSKMDSMEKGNTPTTNNNLISPLSLSAAGFDDDDDDDSNFNTDDVKDKDYRTSASFPKDLHRNGLRIRIASNYSNSTPNPNPNPNPNPTPKFGYNKSRFSEYGTPPQLDEGPRFASRNANNNGGAAAGSSSVSGMGMGVNINMMKKKKRSALGKREREKSNCKGDKVATEMVEAIRVLGDGFVRMEMMKMEMMRESEKVRMDNDMKRTQMFLQSQHNLVQGFLKAWSDNLLHNHNHNHHAPANTDANANANANADADADAANTKEE